MEAGTRLARIPRSNPAAEPIASNLKARPKVARATGRRCPEADTLGDLKPDTSEPGRVLKGGIWSGRRDLNPRLRPWQGRTLPLSYSRSANFTIISNGLRSGNVTQPATGDQPTADPTPAPQSPR